NGLLDQAVNELEKLLSSDQNDIDALILLSRAYIGQNDIPAAGKLLESAVTHGIDDARVYAELAEVYREGGFFENSIPAMRIAVQKAPKNIEYLYKYGFLLVDSKAPAAAIIRLSEYVKEFPEAARLWLGLGIAYQSEGSSAQAKVSFEKALTIDPNMLPALAYLANAYTEAGQSL